MRCRDWIKAQTAALARAGGCTPAEATEAADFMDRLADRELRGEITRDQAMAELDAFARQLERRTN
jgi:hypothetical protein